MTVSQELFTELVSKTLPNEELIEETFKNKIIQLKPEVGKKTSPYISLVSPNFLRAQISLQFR